MSCSLVYNNPMLLYGFLALVFARPFISSTTFPRADGILTLWLAGFCLLLAFLKRARAPSLGALRCRVSLFLGAVVISAFLSRCPALNLLASERFAAGLLLFLTGFSLTKDEKNKTAHALLYGAAAVSIVALYQFAYGFAHMENYLAAHHIQDEFARAYIEKRRVFAPFFSPNILAGYLAMIAPLCLALPKNKWLLVPISLAFLLTQSLGAFLSLILSLGIVFLAAQKTPVKKTLLLTAAGLTAAGILLLWLRSGDSSVIRQPAFSVAMRIEYWAQALAIVKECPWTGVGTGLFDLPSARHAHNIVLEIWAKTGIIGLAAFIFLAAGFLIPAARKIRLSSSSPLLTAGFCGLLAFLIQNLWDISFFFPEAASAWWLLAGMVASMSLSPSAPSGAPHP
ncbi:MAG: O-antigen ligase family protein [Candidatus Omnitrophica bacterium]|nr:O-antigen ligase family protein [Candidatus Omnitrophota bacterium]